MMNVLIDLQSFLEKYRCHKRREKWY